MLTRMAVVALMTAFFTIHAVEAQEAEKDGFQEGVDMFSEGARRFMQEFAGELGPLLMQLEALMDEITSYQAPEILENGDIIIRRRPDVPPPPPPVSEGEDPIDL